MTEVQVYLVELMMLLALEDDKIDREYIAEWVKIVGKIKQDDLI